jgi:hypothetical protein
LTYGPRSDVSKGSRAQQRTGPGSVAHGAAAAQRESVLALQCALGNRGTIRVLARKGGSGRGTFENSVRIGKLGPIEITESNIADWIGKKADADDLIVTTVKGKHSGELKRMSDSKARTDDDRHAGLDHCSSTKGSGLPVPGSIGLAGALHDYPQRERGPKPA